MTLTQATNKARTMATDNKQSAFVMFGFDCGQPDYQPCLEEDLLVYFKGYAVIATINPDPPEGY